jgi:KDO2-lipid IV(A) lauroyltransferase
MSRFLYWILLVPISLLPYWVLYRVSDFFFVVLYYILGYRKRVVRRNIENSFPEKSTAEKRKIERGFYRHFCDLIIETVKQFTVSKKEAEKRMTYQNVGVFEPYEKLEQSVMICGGHYNNWELWAITGPLHLKHQVVGIYKKIADPFFDEKMRSTRGRFGTLLVRTLDIAQYIKDHHQEMIAPVFAFDQSPANPRKSYWTTFLHQETACYYGPETISREYAFPIVYAHIYKVKRGHYTTVYELIEAQPQNCPKGQIIEKLHVALTHDINKQPSSWLWSHKRWKHKRPDGVAFQHIH